MRQLIGFLAVTSAVPASAQVYALGDDGDVLVRIDGGSVAWQAYVQFETPAALNPAPQSRIGQPASISAPASYGDALAAASHSSGLPVELLEAVIWQESRWNQSAISPKGAVGLMQLMPGTARDLGVNPYDAASNMLGGARYLRSLYDRYGGNLTLALAAYNAGPDRVDKAGGIPPIRETQDYVRSVLGRLAVRSAAR